MTSLGPPIRPDVLCIHTINLCAKSILKHFDLSKKKDKDALDQAANVLADLADSLDHEADRGWEKGNSNKKEADD